MELIVAPLLTSVGLTSAATVATTIGTSGIMSALGVLGTVASGISSMMAGQQQQAMYQMQSQQAQMQAQQAELRSRADELKYRQQGVAALDRTLSTVATIAARAGAGSIDPFSGSALNLSTFAFGKGFGEFNLAQESAALARETGVIGMAAGNIQSGIYAMSGEQAAMAGTVRGVGNIFSGLYQASQIGGPSLSGPSDLSQYPAANVPLPLYRPA